MKTRALMLPLLFAGCLTLAVVQAQEGSPGPSILQTKIDKSSSELDRIRQEIAEQQNLMSSLDNQEAQVKRDNQDILKEIDLIQQLLGEMDQRERLLGEQSAELSASLERSRSQYQHSRQALAGNLRSMYMKGGNNNLEMILTADSFSGFVTRLRYEALLTRLGAGLMDRIRQDGSRIQTEQKQLEVARAEINLSREEASLQTSRLEELMAEQQAALRNLRNERKGIKNRLLELSMNEQRLTYILEDLEQQRQQATAQAVPQESALQDLAGQLEWPVRGEVLRGFGRSVHPRFKTVTLNNGVNIAAQVGAPVAAVGTGAVEFSDVLPGFGQCVILDHGAGYYTLYAHLDQVFVTKGEQIAGGQVIAEVGRPAAGEPSQLYFEVRHGKTPLDPSDWLKSR
jgi:septal ring factor EnvC (AmiA/AmiB activator)